MVNREMIEYVKANQKDGLIEITKLWELLSIHEEIVCKQERDRIRDLFIKHINSVQFLIDLDKNN